MHAMRALIVDSGQGRGSLAAARGLARAGWTVGMAGPARAGLPMLSRSVRHRHVVPPHASGANGFLRAIDSAIAARGYEVVFGCGDAEILTLSRERDRIRARVPHAPHKVMLRAIDKVELGAAAREVGMATPPVAASGTEARERWGAGPSIVKERLHGTSTAGGAFTHLAPQALVDPAAVDRRVQEIRAAGAVPVVQPMIEGRLMAFASVVDEQGRMLARVQQVAERTYPRDAGLSVRARTVPVDEQLAGQVSLLLGELGWFGLSELQFILPADGAPVLLDFNGRFYGSLALALAAGVNLPDAWARIATGRDPAEAGDARPGVRYQWLEGDLRAARERSRGPLRDAAGCLRYGIGAGAGIWSARDPLPGLLTAGTLLSQTARLMAKGGERAGNSAGGGAAS
jgi:predicted ATP-grasp superfamily ATP-dependent carboligase